MELFKKSVVIGVSVTPEVGLEVAQIDFATRTVLKYAVRPLEYDINRRDIADLDIFKETLSDLLEELQLPKGTSIVLSLPAVTFRVNDYPASLDEEQVGNVVILDGVEDSHNVGAIIRSCVCAGVKGIILPSRRGVLINSTVEKTSAGAVNHISIIKVNSLVGAVQKLKENNYWVIASDHHAKDNYFDVDYKDMNFEIGRASCRERV